MLRSYYLILIILTSLACNLFGACTKKSVSLNKRPGRSFVRNEYLFRLEHLDYAGDYYEGVFEFRNDSSHCIKVHGFDKLVGNKFAPASENCEIFENNQWKALHCNLPTVDVGIKDLPIVDLLPGKSYEIIFYMPYLDELREPAVIRISLDGLLSESFTFNKKNVDTKKVSDQKRKRCEDVRNALIRIGFKKEVWSFGDSLEWR